MAQKVVLSAKCRVAGQLVVEWHPIMTQVPNQHGLLGQGHRSDGSVNMIVKLMCSCQDASLAGGDIVSHGLDRAGLVLT